MDQFLVMLWLLIPISFKKMMKYIIYREKHEKWKFANFSIHNVQTVVYRVPQGVETSFAA